MMNYFKLIFSNNSILRTLQVQEFKNFKFNGLCLEFGANHKLDRNFLRQNSKNYKTIYSNIDKKNKNFLFLDLEKKNNYKKKYDNIVIFNVLEHIYKIDQSFENLRKLLKKNGKIFASTPFLYRVHGAPHDYNRYTKEFIMKKLKEKKFTKIKIETLGLGPFLASFSLLRGYFKFLPGIYHFFLAIFILMDKSLFFFMKKNPKTIFPIGYVFTAVKK